MSEVEISRQGAVQLIRMNRPEKKNAITRAMYAAMAGALRAADDDPEIRANLILGVPGAFSAGNDLADFMAVATTGAPMTETWDFLQALSSARKPLISAADGIAVGIGTTIHLHCDLTLATPRTRFHTSFVDLGLIPEAASSLLLPRLLGHQRAFAMLGLAEPMPAQNALEQGLIYQIVPEAELEPTAIAVAQSVAAKPPEALRIARDLMLGSRDDIRERIEIEGRAFAERLKSDEARAAFMAFMSRKK